MVEVHFESVVHRKDGSFALASSALTGQIWDGNLWVFRSYAEFKECPNLFLTNTRMSAGMSDVIWLNDETRLLVALDTGELEVWSCSPLGCGLEQSGSLKSHDDMALCICRLGGGGVERVVSGGADGRVILWDIATERQVRNYKGHMHMVVSVGCDPKSEIFLSSSQDNTVRLWDLRLPKPARNFQACRDGIYTSIAWSSESLAVGNEKGAVQVIDPRNDYFLFSNYQPHSRVIRRLSFSPSNSSLLASVSDDAKVRVQSLVSNEIVYSHSGHTDFVRGISWEWPGNESGCGLVTCGWDGQLLQHDISKLLSIPSDSSDLPHHSGNMKTDNMVGNISNIRSNDDRDKEAIH